MSMVTIDIELIDTKAAALGIESDEKIYAVFNFRAGALSGFWVDPDDEQIKLYIHGISYLTPYLKETEELFINILKGKII